MWKYRGHIVLTKTRWCGVSARVCKFKSRSPADSLNSPFMVKLLTDLFTVKWYRTSSRSRCSTSDFNGSYGMFAGEQQMGGVCHSYKGGFCLGMLGKRWRVNKYHTSIWCWLTEWELVQNSTQLVLQKLHKTKLNVQKVEEKGMMGNEV